MCSEPSFEVYCPPRRYEPRRRCRPRRQRVSSREYINDACRSYLKCQRKPEPNRTPRPRNNSHYTPAIHSYTPSAHESYITKSFTPSEHRDGMSRDPARYAVASREIKPSSLGPQASRPHTSSAHAPYSQQSRDRRSYASLGRESTETARASRENAPSYAAVSRHSHAPRESGCVSPRTRESRWPREPEEDPCCDDDNDDDDDDCDELYVIDPCPPLRTERCEPVPECPPEECYTVREVCRPARVCRVQSRPRRSAQKRAPVVCCDDDDDDRRYRKRPRCGVTR